MMTSKLQDNEKFVQSVKHLFAFCASSGMRASRACRKVYELSRTTKDAKLARKLVRVSDALNEQRHMLGAIKIDNLGLAKHHSEAVTKYLSDAGVS